MSKQCKCGNQEFRATQRIRCDVIVDEEGNFLRNDSEDGVRLCASQADSPYGPFTCTKCESEYDDLDELEELEEDWQAKFAEKAADLQIALGILRDLRDGEMDDSNWPEVDNLLDRNGME